MRRIRIGNDFEFNWEIKKAELPVDLESVLDIHIYATVMGIKRELIEYDIHENIITLYFTPEIINKIGKYNIELRYSLPDMSLPDEDRHFAVDVDAFVIVGETAEADDHWDFALTSAMALGFKGDPFLYEDFTEEHIQSFKQPAIDAANISTIKVDNKLSLVDSEEQTRQTNESNRVSSETTRKANEVDRVNAEDIRISSENTRKSSETNRISVENVRITSEAQRVSDEIERKNAETTRKNSEVDRLNAEQIRLTNEASRINAEIIRINAELDRIEAEDLREIAEDLRQTNTQLAIDNVQNTANYVEDRKSFIEEAIAHPPVIIDSYWHQWNFISKEYESTGIYSRGDSAVEGSLVLQSKGNSAVHTMSQEAITNNLNEIDSKIVPILDTDFEQLEVVDNDIYYFIIEED